MIAQFGRQRAVPAGMSKQQSKAAALQKRMTDFAAEIIMVASDLPQTQPAKHVAGQLIRSGTATAANYAEARSAESLSDFIHKLRIVLKELNETEVWLELITKSSWLSPEKIIAIVAENRELCRITAASIKTARSVDRP